MRAQPAAVCVTLRLGRTIRSTTIEIETVGGGWSALRARLAGSMELAAGIAALVAAGVAAGIAAGINETKLNTDPLFGADIII